MAELKIISMDEVPVEEDGLEDTIKPRLEAAEADCSQIKVIKEEM